MKFIPILFSTPMVQAIMEGRKTQTRRTNGLDVVNENPNDWELCWVGETVVNKKYPKVFGAMFQNKHNPKEVHFVACPYGQPGDVLWVRESWYTQWQYDDVSPSMLPSEAPFYYQATLDKGYEGRLRPSIHMPKAACRNWLKVKSVRVERLQDISEGDAISEGVGKDSDGNWMYYGEEGRGYAKSAITSFISLWGKINGWDSVNANPWVWVVEFEKLDAKPEGF